uniref:Uncharacterized protein LOC113795325 n=1 Tax=Dermatophagoides pteronyssinus TaxID=6956 RepID=A0A6P6Y7E6_DERPT|nr:uncharacterized protein LOC113795325 [Dermatophagoides pteronyssinus]
MQSKESNGEALFAELSNGCLMPALMFGTYQIASRTQVDSAVGAAVECGYIGFDDADYYKNEELVGHVPEVKNVLDAVALKHGVSYTAVMLRWLLQRGFTVLPRSGNPQHICDNIKCQQIELSDEEMQQIDNIKFRHRVVTDPDVID